jgi:transposase InsO family protein
VQYGSGVDWSCRDIVYSFTIPARADPIMYADTIGSAFDTSLFVQTITGAVVTVPFLTRGMVCNDDDGLMNRDLFSRAVVGWSLDATLATTLPLRALNVAVRRRRPEAGLLHHSDRGCQYTSADYRRALAGLGVTVSMSRKGNCWDNAVAESFFATLKTELIRDRHWQSRLELRAAVFGYIEVF